MIVITTRTSYEPLAQTSLMTACPLCNHEAEIDLSFYRISKETNGVYTKTKRMTSSAKCSYCQKDVPVTQWTSPMQQTFENFKRETHLKREVTYSKRFWWAIGIGVGAPVLLLAVALVGGSFASRQAATNERMLVAVISQPQVNDKLIVLSIADRKQVFHLYNVTAVDDTTITATASQQTNTNAVAKFSNFDMSDSVFTGETVTVLKEPFMTYKNWTNVKDPSNANGVYASVWAALRQE
jgi:hypothetical protein